MEDIRKNDIAIIKDVTIEAGVKIIICNSEKIKWNKVHIYGEWE